MTTCRTPWMSTEVTHAITVDFQFLHILESVAAVATSLVTAPDRARSSTGPITKALAEA